jgi:hypothetical protein
MILKSNEHIKIDPCNKNIAYCDFLDITFFRSGSAIHTHINI